LVFFSKKILLGRQETRKDTGDTAARTQSRLGQPTQKYEDNTPCIFGDTKGAPFYLDVSVQ
jgi:hypothetical protein